MHRQSDARGGKVLTLLHDNIAGYTGDCKAQDLCVHLMQAASVPYMKMLGMWIYKGIVSDPIKEVRKLFFRLSNLWGDDIQLTMHLARRVYFEQANKFAEPFRVVLRYIEKVSV